MNVFAKRKQSVKSKISTKGNYYRKILDNGGAMNTQKLDKTYKQIKINA